MAASWYHGSRVTGFRPRSGHGAFLNVDESHREPSARGTSRMLRPSMCEADAWFDGPNLASCKEPNFLLYTIASSAHGSRTVLSPRNAQGAGRMGESFHEDDGSNGRMGAFFFVLRFVSGEDLNISLSSSTSAASCACSLVERSDTAVSDGDATGVAGTGDNAATTGGTGVDATAGEGAGDNVTAGEGAGDDVTAGEGAGDDVTAGEGAATAGAAATGAATGATTGADAGTGFAGVVTGGAGSTGAGVGEGAAIPPSLVQLLLELGAAGRAATPLTSDNSRKSDAPREQLFSET